MDRQPVLEGDRLLLRPLREDDWSSLHAAASDPEVWAQHPVPDRWREPVFRAYFDDALAGRGALAVVSRETGRVVGSSRFMVRPPAGPGEIEIGSTFLARSLWGTGANAEMKRLMLGHAFRFVERVLFLVGEGNWRSRRAMEKIGGRLTDERFVAVVNGRELPHVIFDIIRESFAAGPLARS